MVNLLENMVLIGSFMEFLKYNRDKIESYFPIFDSLIKSDLLKKAILYSLKGGKKIRGSLLIELAKGLKKVKLDRSLYLLALAIEMIHSYSLIHDDLPAMDDDDFRRGKPSLHKAFGEDIAILAGDTLLTHSFDLIISTNYSPEIKVEIVKLFVEAAGGAGMIYGQVIDIKDTIETIEQLNILHENKTGKMLQLPIKIALIISKVDNKTYSDFLTFAKNIGVAFQAKDDLLDVVGDQKKVGKTLNKDKDQNKKRYPDFMGISGTEKEIENLTKSGLDIIKKYNIETMEQIAHFLQKREY